jgi:hypothetical protein
MKKIILLGTSLMVLSITAQKNEVPTQVKNEFAKTYNLPSETSTSWVTNENSYTVTFTSQGFKNEITYNKDGQRIESLSEMSKARLNEKQIAYINANYKKAKILHTYLLQSEVAPERYVIDLEMDGITTRLFFRPDGEFQTEQKL